MSGCSSSSIGDIDLYIRSADSDGKLQSPMWVDNCLFDTATAQKSSRKVSSICQACDRTFAVQTLLVLVANSKVMADTVIFAESTLVHLGIEIYLGLLLLHLLALAFLWCVCGPSQSGVGGKGRHQLVALHCMHGCCIVCMHRSKECLFSMNRVCWCK